jgi:1-acyl-sn-glycerol-3-phosphate acyltransferase
MTDELRTSRAATGRNLAALVLRAWRLHVDGADLVPAGGPVLLAANHLGVLDGPALAVASPRPVHVLVKSGAYVPPLSGLLRRTAQIAIDYEGPDRSALHAARDVLDAGGVVGIFPEAHRGAGDVQHVRHGVAYLAAATGAPVVPVAVLGMRPAGGGKDALPKLRSRVDVVFGVPLDIRVDGDPRRRAVLARSGEHLRQALADHVRDACARTGQTLPGPLPAPTAERSST